MPNYIVLNSKFKPFSFDEIMKPALLATESHRELEDQYADLATKSSVWEEMANEQTDPYAYSRYKRFAEDLEAQADQLAKEGLTPLSRRNMLKMRQRYSSDIIPIEQAYNRRKELIDEQRKLLAQDNTLMFDRSASMLSLDDLIKNPQLTYQSYSGATLTKQVGTAAQNLAKEMRENPRKRSILGNQYFETIMQNGYRPEEIIQVLQNDPNASSVLKGIIEDAVDSSNIASWGNQDTLNRAYNYAKQGLWNAIGNTQYQIQSNKAYDYAMQQARARAAKEDKDRSRLYYRAVPKTTVDEDKKTKQMDKDLKLIQELIANPDLINQKDTRTVRDPKMISPDPQVSFTIDSGLGESRQETYYPYQEKLKELSKRYGNTNFTITNGKLTDSNLEELAQQLDSDIRSSAVRAFSYKPNITQSDLITQVLKENIRSYNRRSNHTGLYKLKDNKKGAEISINDLNNYFTSDSDIDFDVDLGFIINSTDKDGKTRSAILDTELLDDPNRTIKRFQDNIKLALDNGEPETATLLIHGYEDENGNHHPGLMEFIYNRYNTLEKRQSNTFSKEE